MTSSPDRRPVVVRDLEEAIEVMRQRGLRLTAARRLVLEAFFKTREPLCAETIAGGLSGTATPCDIASVYRNLETLGELGIIRHFHAGHGPGRYVLQAAGDQEYVVCESCGALKSFDPSALDVVRDRVRELAGFEASFSHFPIVGLCPSCARTAERGRARGTVEDGDGDSDGP
ncbi:MAG: Fur family transcriptional regulator [Solirubrobacteraceae bacterium]